MSKASKLVLMLFIGLLFAVKPHVQELKLAPTLEQCRADQRLWLDKVEKTTLAEDYFTINNWAGEMLDCGVLIPRISGSTTMSPERVHGEKVLRLEHFLDRHNLYDKFIEEDKAGKR
jgi:hypothetical protein